MVAVPTRSLRAIREYMSVVEAAPDLYTVYGESGREYTVDLRGDPACTCPDFEYRDDVRECKHVRRVRLVTGTADVDRLRRELDAVADDAENEADTLARQADELRSTARGLRDALDRLESLGEGADG